MVLAERSGHKPAPVRGVVTILARGRTAGDVVDALMAEFVSEPRVVEVDLTGTTEEGTAVREAFAPVGHYLRQWPGTVVLVHVPDPDVRSALATAEYAGHLLIHTTWDSDALRAHRLLPRVQRRTLSLSPIATAPGTARDFVTRTMQDWRLPSLTTPASQVLSEFVAHAAVQSDDELGISLSRVDTRVRLALTDPTVKTSATLSDLPQYPLSGRARQLVEALANGWGIIRGRPVGTTVWAVIDALPAALADDRRDASRARKVPRHRGRADPDVLSEMHSQRTGRHRRTDALTDGPRDSRS